MPDDLDEAFRARAQSVADPRNRKDKGYTTVLEAALRSYLDAVSDVNLGEPPEHLAWVDSFRLLTPGRRRIGLILLDALRRDQNMTRDEDSDQSTSTRNK